MRAYLFPKLLAAVGIVGATVAGAREPLVERAISRPVAMKSAAYEVDEVEPEAASAAESSSGEIGGDGCTSCNSGCGTGDCGDCGCADSDCADCGCDDDEGFSLASALCVSGTQWEIGGWTQLGYHDNQQPLSQATDDLLSFNDVPDRVRLQQQWLYFGRKADGACGWDLGGRVDVLYGTDAQKTQSFGNPGAGLRNQGQFDASWDHGIYGFAMPQLYAEVAAGDLSVKLGHFFTIIGYEVIPANGNFFYSHSYAMFNSQPFTHTGALATYTGYEDTTLYGGWVLGWDTGFDQLNSGNAFLGGVSRKLSDEVTLTYASTYGNFGWRDGGSDDSYSHSIVLDTKLTDCVNYVFQSDYLRTDNPGVSNFDTISVNNYLFYTVNDVVRVGGRHEWWKADGVSFNAVTGGVNFRTGKNLVIRPEIRHDWAPGIGLDEDTAGVDAILTY